MSVPVFPLYRGLQAPLAPNPGTMHMGLWFERFFHGYESDFAAVDKEGRQFDIKQVGARSELQAKAEKIQQLAASQGGQARIYQCVAPFVTGMGNPHPLENGFTWHPTLGMPYLPGSAVKGLARAAVELAYQGADKPALLKRWFGPCPWATSPRAICNCSSLSCHVLALQQMNWSKSGRHWTTPCNGWERVARRRRALARCSRKRPS